MYSLRSAARGRRPGIAFLCAALGLLAGARADDSSARVAVPARRQTAAELARQLDRPVTWSWSGQTLAGALDSLAAAQRLALFRDRRVDPARPIDLSVAGLPLREALDQAAGRVGLGVAILGPVVYWGPPEAARKLRTLAELRRADAQRLRPKLRLALAEPRPLAWPRLSTPRAIVAALADEVGLALAHEEALPHDLWPRVELPAMSASDRLTLALIGFDLTYEVDDEQGRLKLVPAPATPTLTRSFPLRGSAEQALAAWRERAPEATVRVRGSRLEADGRLEDFERFAAGPRPGAPRPPRASQQSYRLNLEVQDKPVGPLVKELAGRLAWSVTFDEQAIQQAGLSLEHKVSASVRGASPEDLFEQLLEPAGLACRIKDGTVRVFPIPRKAER